MGYIFASRVPQIQERVQRKLSKVHVPPFVGELVVSGVHLGNSVPQLRSVGAPWQDHRGLSCELDVLYEGNFTMTIETKLDLIKLKKSASLSSKNNTSESSNSNNNNSSSNNSQYGTPITTADAPNYHHQTRSTSSRDLLPRDIHFDTDTDDSVESSSDDDMGGDEEVEGSGSGGGGGRRRLLRLVDTVAGSRYFQHASQWGVLQKAMRGVSNTKIELAVTVERLCGALTVNIAPQPSDRLWYGFKTPPQLIMVAKPRVGTRTLNLTFLSDFIQKQLYVIFEKVFVMPNMDDLVVPIMSPLLPGQTDLPRPPWEKSRRHDMPPTSDSPAAAAAPLHANVSDD